MRISRIEYYCLVRRPTYPIERLSHHREDPKWKVLSGKKENENIQQFRIRWEKILHCVPLIMYIVIWRLRHDSLWVPLIDYTSVVVDCGPKWGMVAHDSSQSITTEDSRGTELIGLIHVNLSLQQHYCYRRSLSKVSQESNQIKISCQWARGE